MTSTTTNIVALDRAWVMHRAWHYMRVWRSAFSPANIGRALFYAWGDMKSKMQGLRLTDELSGNEKELMVLENRNHQTRDDIARMGHLRTAITHENAEADYSEKRDLIEAGPCSVTFTKADGSQRTMRVEPGRVAQHVKGDSATKPGQRATKTRKARHPHLMPVWDAGRRAVRSVNLATVSRIAVGGQVHRYA